MSKYQDLCETFSETQKTVKKLQKTLENIFVEGLSRHLGYPKEVISLDIISYRYAEEKQNMEVKLKLHVKVPKDQELSLTFSCSGTWPPDRNNFYSEEIILVKYKGEKINVNSPKLFAIVHEDLEKQVSLSRSL